MTANEGMSPHRVRHAHVLQDNFQFVDASAIMREMRHAPREHREAYFALRALMEVGLDRKTLHCIADYCMCRTLSCQGIPERWHPYLVKLGAICMLLACLC